MRVRAFVFDAARQDRAKISKRILILSTERLASGVDRPLRAPLRALSLTASGSALAISRIAKIAPDGTIIVVIDELAESGTARVTPAAEIDL